MHLKNWAGLVLGLAVGFSAQAAITYSNLGPEHSFLHGEGWTAGNVDGHSDYVPAELFTPTTTGWLTSATAPLWSINGTLGPVDFEIRTDDAGLPGQVVDTGVVQERGKERLYTALFADPMLLRAGHHYWFSIETTDPSAAVVWDFTNTGVTATMAFTGAAWQQPGDWYVQQWTAGALQVNVVAVPEPATWLLLPLGLAGVAAQRRRRA
jgi:hypothetical protein